MTEPQQPPQIPEAQVVGGGYWENGVFHSPEGWPEGAGWIVRDADGTIVNSGPASDFALVASTDLGNSGPMPPASDLSAALKGLPEPAKAKDSGE